MKATIEFDDALYRRLKIEAARSGRTIKDLVDEGIRQLLGAPSAPKPAASPRPPEWYGALSRYAGAADSHDMTAIRRSIAGKRTQP